LRERLTEMMRNLKILGLALLAVFAIGAVAASAASAEGSITGSTTKVKLTATGGTTIVVQYDPHSDVRCQNHYDFGEVGVTPHGPIDLPVSAVTDKPTYSNCKAFLNNKEVGRATVTMGTCDYVLHVGTATGDVYNGSTDIKCESGDMTIDVWALTNTTHTGTPICSYSLSEQLGKTGPTLTSNGTSISFGGTITGLSATRNGIICGGAGSTSSATMPLSAASTATNEAEESVSVSLSG
jgi:hypothetical protein